MMARVSYRSGDWFAVPLREGGWALGVIARANPEGILVGYFFAAKSNGSVALEDAEPLDPADAVLVRRFGHLGLVNGKWPILGRLDDWDQSEWPIPNFGRFEELSGRCFKVVYDDDDPNKVLREDVVPREELDELPRDGLLGAGAVEKVLTGLLRR